MAELGVLLIGLGLEVMSFTAHAVSYGAQGAFYVADEARRAVGSGPAVTTFEVELIPPAGAPAGEGKLFSCARFDGGAASAGQIRCLNRSYFTSISGFAEADGGSNVWRFQIPVDDAPESMCFDFSDHVEVWRRSWFIGGVKDEKEPVDLRPNAGGPYAKSFSALPVVTRMLPPFGTLCLSGVPSSGEVTVKGVSCPAGAESACRAADVVVVPK